MTFILIISLLMLIIFYLILKKKENFTNCHIQNYETKKKFTPIGIQNSAIDLGNYSNLQVLSLKNLKNKLKIFNVIKTNIKYNELNGLQYNYYKIKGNKINPFVKIVKQFLHFFKDNLENIVSDKKICQGINPCKVNILKYVILKLSIKEDKKLINGQFLFKFKNRSFQYLIHFIISNENGLSIHKLKAIDMHIDNNTKNLDNSTQFFSKNAEIYSRPFMSKYNAHNTYLYSSNEQKILVQKMKDKKKIKTKKPPFDPFAPRCYGKDTDNKLDCEKEYEVTTITDLTGKKIKKIKKMDVVGIWDKPCKTNSECPFYKKNKNYPNNFGKCKGNRYCEFPIGVTELSPHFYTNEKSVICYNCKKGINCCKEQENNRSKYKKLNSPDYFFKGDKVKRIKYYNMLKKKGLEIYNVLDYRNL
jgi:hypothetical protein